jgi:DNA-binding XRE family transcriptional regulator
MHLVHFQKDPQLLLFYQKRKRLARADSLPYFFYRMRIHRNLTKEALAKKCNVSPEYVTAIENGSKFPSLRFCLCCSEIFNANPGWVKNKWAKEAIERFSSRLMKRLGFDQNGGVS